MSTTASQPTFGPVFDLLGVGFGPAGIALAAAFEDWREENRIAQAQMPKVRFLERRPDSAWQPRLLLPGTDISHHYLRDLATPRNPRSRFTFANYLKERGRVFSFGLLRGAATRLEWSDYIVWAARQLRNYVAYDTTVRGIEPWIEDGAVQCLKIDTGAGAVLARDLVINTGQEPLIPEEYAPWIGERFFHTSNFLPRIEQLDKQANLTFALIGSGQSAAESLVYLHDEFKASTFYSIHRRVGFKLLDDGHFSQQIYFPAETDYFFNLAPDHRAHALQDIWQTNYASVDWEISRALYSRMYEARVLGQERVFICNRRRLLDIAQVDGRYVLNLADAYSGEPHRQTVDVVVLCTGYREAPFPAALAALRPYLAVDGQGGLAVRRDYRVETHDNFRPRIFLNGLCERTHGMSDSTSFSMMALKAERIFHGWRRHHAATAAASAVPMFM